jgi:hypothetical protein
MFHLCTYCHGYKTGSGGGCGGTRYKHLRLWRNSNFMACRWKLFTGTRVVMSEQVPAHIELSLSYVSFKSPRRRNSINFSRTHSLVKLFIKISHRLDDGDGVGIRNLGLYRSPDAAVCPRKLCFITFVVVVKMIIVMIFIINYCSVLPCLVPSLTIKGFWDVLLYSAHTYLLHGAESFLRS